MNRKLDLFKPAAFSFVCALASACGGGGGGGGTAATPIAITPDAVVAAVAAKIGSTTMTREPGTPPAPSASAGAPTAAAGVSTAKSEPGTTANIPLNVQSSAAIQAIFAKVRGSSSFYQANISATTARRAQSKRSTAKVAKQLPGSDNFNLSLDIPSSLGTGQFCVDLSVRDANQLVSNLAGFCVDVVREIQEPANDQPSANALPSALAGAWRTPCETFDGSSIQFGFTFGLPNTYGEFVEVWENTSSCAGTPDFSEVLLQGTYSAGATRFNRQSGVHELFFDFTPAANSNGQQICFNLLRIAGNQLLLGIPAGVSFSDEANEPGSCASNATRPFTVATSFPFIKGAAPSPTPSENSPAANAGPDQTVPAGASVTLNGTASRDGLGGTNLSYAWSGGGGQVALQNANTAIASFVAPSNNSFTLVLGFTLTVTDASTGQSTSDQVSVTINPPANQQSLTVNAGANQSYTSNQTAHLLGSVTPSDGVTVQWTQVGGPSVSLNGANTLTPSFTTPTIPQGGQPQNLIFRLTATRSGSAAAFDEVAVLVSSVALNAGNLRFTLTWDDAANDQDLYVREPSGDLIFYASSFRCTNPPSASGPASGCTVSRNGGALDVDDVSGFGPENVFYSGAVASGSYCYGVRYFSSTGPATTNTISVTLDGTLLQTSTAAFTATSAQGLRQTAFFVMTLNGSSASFRPATAADFPSGGGNVCPEI